MDYHVQCDRMWGWNTRNSYGHHFLSLLKFLDLEYHELYLLRMLSQRKKERKGGQGNYPSQENKNAKIETPGEQSALTSHNKHQKDSVILNHLTRHANHQGK